MHPPDDPNAQINVALATHILLLLIRVQTILLNKFSFHYFFIFFNLFKFSVNESKLNI